MKTQLKRILITLLATIVLYYFILPPINLQSIDFYYFILLISIVYFLTGIINFKLIINKHEFINIKKKSKKLNYCLFGYLGVIILIFIINIIVSPLFNSKSWANRITVNKDNEFTTDIKEVDFDKLPLLDKESSRKLGDRVMGEMPELVSQFYVSNLYTQINYNEKIVRVTPLEYNGFIKYLNNYQDGVKGYIIVNSVSGETELVKLDQGMKYMPSAYFFKNLYRHVRIKYPTAILGNESFEIDNEGNPYWVIQTIKYSGIGTKKDISGIILVDAITGKTSRYSVDEIPTWIDQVYNANLIIEQVDDWGQYQKGYLNSIFTQNGVVQTTKGYNYTVMNDDVYLYTGITSVSNDESNIGFIMTNLRTKETNFYQVPGAEEYSAMASAEGQVQQMKYNSSFPLLINVNGRATYLMSLKDSAGLVKMYAFVDVKDYQKVVVTDSSLGIKEAYNNYINNVNLTVDVNNMKEKEITINSIKEVIIDGNTYYYLTDIDNQKYKVSIKVNQDILPYLERGNKITISYLVEKEVIEIKSIK